MNPVLRSLLGLGEGADRWSQGRVTLSGWSVGMAAAILTAFALWTFMQYWRDGTSPSWWMKAPLATMRILAAACLLMMLLEPLVTWTRTSTVNQTFIVLADRSPSMEFLDPRLPDRLADPIRRATGRDPRATRRRELASAVLAAKNADVLARLGRRFDLRGYVFDDDATVADLRTALTAQGASGAATQIGTALRTALDDNTGAPVAGILIVSDGGSNLGDDPVVWARRARALGIPVHTLGIGDPTPTRDIAVSEALADRVVRKDSEVRVFVGVRNRGFGGRTVTLTLTRNGAPVASRTVTLASDDAKQTVSFTYTPKQVGQFTYSVAVTRLPDETTYDNNARRYFQQVVDKKLRVLYVEGEPRWEYRYLRNAILRDDQIGFACFRTDVPDRPVAEGNLPVTAFPSDERQLFAYDILILGDVPRQSLQNTHLRAIRRFVEDRGGSLIVIAGERHMPHAYADTIIEPLFPLSVGTAPDPVIMDEPFQWQRTPAGAQDPVLRMHPDPAEDERIWRDLPGMLWMAGSQRAKPGATVLAVNPARSTAAGPRPVVAVQPYGAGRCLMIMTDSTWRWRWKVGDRHFYRFWGQVLRTMTPLDNPGGNRFAQISVDRAEYRPGDRVQVTARLLDEFYRPSRLPQLTATLSRVGSEVPGLGSERRSVSLRAVAGSPGLFTADLTAPSAGEYSLSLRAPEGGDAGATTRFLVQQVSLEAQQPEMHEATLRRIAEAGGGRYLRAEDVAAWAEALRAKPLTVKTTAETPIWHAPIVLIVAITLLATEWLLRRRAGLT
ncbi:MAG: hypothetical protein GX446_14195 [Chthonomonadales bacterium]|nr:hypothetical protein [Chthonomonadales bacterium]